MKRGTVARIGLALGAGGFAGLAFHSAVLSAVQEATGWDPRSAEVVVGTSAGARVGALLRTGFSADDLAAYETGRPLSEPGQRLLARMGKAPVLERPPRRSFVGPPHLPSRALLRRFARHPWDYAGALVTSFLPDGPIPSEDFARALRALCGSAWPADPLWICASRAADGERVVFGRDEGVHGIDVGTAVAASCAIPGYFAPIDVNGFRFVDGAVHSPTNLDLLVGGPFDLVIAISPMSIARRVYGTPDLPLRRVFRLRLGQEARRVEASGIPVVAFQPGAEELRAIGLNAMDGNRMRWRRATIAIRDATLTRLETAELAERLQPLAA